MKRNEYILIGVIVLVISAILFLVSRSNTPHYKWSEINSIESEEPYGNSLLYTLLGDYFPENKVNKVNEDIREELKQALEKGGHTNYMFLGHNMHYSIETYQALAEFVASGNDAFILANSPNTILYQLWLQQGNEESLENIADTENEESLEHIADADIDFYSNWSSSMETSQITCNFTAKGFRTSSGYTYTYNVIDQSENKSWNYYLPDYLNAIPTVDILGTMQTPYLSNFIRIPHGSGYFYIHLEPILFSNYYLLNEDKLEYTNKVFSYMKPGDIIWDEFSKNYTKDRNNDRQEEGPLRFILSNPALRAGWYTLLGGLLLFLLFRTKRLQKPIPVLEPNENRSLEFVQTIGRMYFIRKNHKQLAHQKIKLFYHFIQDRYQIPTAQIDDAFKLKLELKSEISMSTINEILKHSAYIERTDEVTEEDILLLHKLIDNFYKHCK